MATAAAKRYARAIFELAEAEGRLEAWSARLAQAEHLLTDPSVRAVVMNPTIATSARMELITGGDLDGEATNLVKLLIESNRVDEVTGIVEEYERLSDEAAGRIRATATTAVPLADADRERIAAQLSSALGKEVRLSVAVDPRILGGLKLQYGDRLVDASVATKLQQLRRRLADAS